ncbi:MAG: hypothetical protein ABFE07_05795 [Armatimonadia bacterium]
MTSGEFEQALEAARAKAAEDASHAVQEPGRLYGRDVHVEFIVDEANRMSGLLDSMTPTARAEFFENQARLNDVRYKVRMAAGLLGLDADEQLSRAERRWPSATPVERAELAYRYIMTNAETIPEKLA